MNFDRFTYWRTASSYAVVAAFLAGLLAGGGLLLSHAVDPARGDVALYAAALGAILALSIYHLARRQFLLVDHAAERLIAAAQGDLHTPVPDMVHASLPDLALAMESLFSQTRTTLENVQLMAMQDGVTGLASRSSFCCQVELLLAGQERNGPAAMFFIDLDGFKAVNDTLGHAAGDHLLTRVAGRLREVVAMQLGTTSDTVIGRYAGDEFTLFFPHIPPESSAMRIARAVQYALEEPFDISGTQVEIGGSIGVAYYPEHGATLSTLLRAADHAMYDAKQNGRGQVRLYSEDLALRLASRAELEHDLRLALERDEFLLEFQPQVDFAAGRVVSAEALVRWEHPRRGLLMPDSFVALAEETGLIVELGDWILNRVCRTASHWAQLGIDQRISINISRRELAQPDFFERLNRAMQRHATPPTALELELTETLMMRLRGDTYKALVELRARGVCIAIDDFGTGFSNLAQLRDLPIDRVKIDRSLVRDIVLSVEARTICSAIVGLVRGLGLSMVVEGIESEEQIDLLRAMGCSVFQGFHLSRPIREAVYLERFGAVEGEREARA